MHFLPLYCLSNVVEGCFPAALKRRHSPRRCATLSTVVASCPGCPVFRCKMTRGSWRRHNFFFHTFVVLPKHVGIASSRGTEHCRSVTCLPNTTFSCNAARALSIATKQYGHLLIYWFTFTDWSRIENTCMCAFYDPTHNESISYHYTHKTSFTSAELYHSQATKNIAA